MDLEYLQNNENFNQLAELILCRLVTLHRPAGTLFPPEYWRAGLIGDADTNENLVHRHTLEPKWLRRMVTRTHTFMINHT